MFVDIASITEAIPLIMSACL